MKDLTAQGIIDTLKKIRVARLSKTEFYELSQELDKMDLVKIEALANKKSEIIEESRIICCHIKEKES